MRANPTPRQRVDRSSPFYHLTLPGIARIPQRGSVWIVQVPSINSAPNLFAREARRTEYTALSRKDLNDPHAAALWDSRAYGVGAPMVVERT